MKLIREKSPDFFIKKRLQSKWKANSLDYPGKGISALLRNCLIFLFLLPVGHKCQ